MKKSFKQIAAATLSAAMVMAPSLNVLAEAPAQGQHAGTGNILAYSITSVIVPTNFQIALNPQGLGVTRLDGENAVTDQIVTFNYGIANLSTNDMVVSLELTVDSGESGITFVDGAEAVEEAKAGELKMYLELVEGSDVKDSEGAAFAVDNGSAGFDSDDLVNVTMTDAESGVVFAGDADVAVERDFELEKATYAVKDGETVNFDTSQEDLAGKMELSELGGITGFTIKGAMNEDADWTTANVKAITFTPEYDIQTALAFAASQGPALTTTEATATAGANTEISFRGSATDVQSVTFNGNNIASQVIITDGKVTVKSSWTDGWNAGMSREAVITFTDGSNGTCTITKG